MSTKFGDLVIAQEKSKIKAGEGQKKGKYKFFTSSNVQTKFVDFFQYDQAALIFGTGGNPSVHYCEEPFSTSTDCIVFYSKNNGYSLKTLYFFFESHMKLLEDGFHGAGLQHISKKYIQNIEVPDQNLEQQLKINQIGDKINLLIQKRKQQILSYDVLIKSRFIEMFGDPVTNPMCWPICELSKYIRFLTSGSRGWAQYFTNNGEYFITIKNVKNCRITLDDVQHIVPPDNAEAKRTRVQEGDLLISITADLGRTGVVTKEIADHGGYINQHLTCIRLNQSAVRPLYVAYYMESDAGKRQFQSKNQSAVKAGLNFNSINTLRLMVPPSELQDVFITFVAQADKSKFSNPIQPHTFNACIS